MVSFSIVPFKLSESSDDLGQNYVDQGNNNRNQNREVVGCGIIAIVGSVSAEGSRLAHRKLGTELGHGKTDDSSE